MDSTDFLTPKTGLTIANTDIKLVINGAASANKNSGGGTHRVNGVYGVTFDATDSATVGEIEVSVVVAGALPVFDKFFVVEEAVYDALFAASAPGFSTVAALATVQTDTDDIQTRIPAALTANGNMKSDPLAINGSANAAANLARGTLGNVLCTVGSASSTTSIVTSAMDPAAATTDQFKGRILTFDRATTTANLRGQSTDITGNTSGGVLTCTALTDAPVSGDLFTIT